MALNFFSQIDYINDYINGTGASPGHSWIGPLACDFDPKKGHSGEYGNKRHLGT